MIVLASWSARMSSTNAELPPEELEKRPESRDCEVVYRVSSTACRFAYISPSQSVHLDRPENLNAQTLIRKPALNPHPYEQLSLSSNPYPHNSNP